MKYTADCNNDLTTTQTNAKRLILKKVLTTKRNDIKTLSEFFDLSNGKNTNTDLQISSSAGFSSSMLTRSFNSLTNMLNFGIQPHPTDKNRYIFKDTIDKLHNHDLGNIYLGVTEGRMYYIHTMTMMKGQRYIVIESLSLDMMMMDYTRHYYDTMKHDHKEWEDVFKLRTITVIGIDNNAMYTYFPSKHIPSKLVEGRGFKKSISTQNMSNIGSKVQGLLPIDPHGRTANHPLAELLGFFLDKHYVYENLYCNWTDEQKNPHQFDTDASLYEQTKVDDGGDLYERLKDVGKEYFNDETVFTDTTISELSVLMSTLYHSVYPLSRGRPFDIKDFMGNHEIDMDHAPNNANLLGILSFGTFADGKLAKIEDCGEHCEIVLTHNGVKLKEYCKENDIDFKLTFGFIFGYNFLRDVVHKVYFDKEYITDFLLRSIHEQN